MLVAAENALVAAIKTHRLVTGMKVRTVSSLPRLALDALLTRYANDAPAIYVVAGSLRAQDDDVIMSFTIAGLVRNVAGNVQARKGDGIDIGCDHLMLATMRAVHAHKIGICSWNLRSAEMVDDDEFDKHGLAAVEMTFEGSPVQIPDDWNLDELDDFLKFHADVDAAPHEPGGQTTYAQWTQNPPVFTSGRPDADLDVTLEGASS